VAYEPLQQWYYKGYIEPYAFNCEILCKSVILIM
jgi:hypothetical protein